MPNEIWKNIEKLINDQLKLQVEISFNKHYSFMFKHGLSECKNVLDIGTGSGDFLKALAMSQPRIKFFGLDNKQHMIEAAKTKKIKNVEWCIADINHFESLPQLGKVDGILMRYFILHLPNIKEALAKIADSIKRGSCLWIIDLDLDCFSCEPAHGAFRLMHDLVERFCDKFSVDTKAATQLPSLLEKSGFEVNERVIAPFTNFEGDKNLFKRFLKNEVEIYGRFLEEDFNTKEMQTIFDFIENEAVNDQYKVKYGMTMIAATKS